MSLYSTEWATAIQNNKQEHGNFTREKKRKGENWSLLLLFCVKEKGKSGEKRRRNGKSKRKGGEIEKIRENRI